MKIYNGALKFSIFCLTVVILYFVFSNATLIPEYIVEKFYIEPDDDISLDGLGDIFIAFFDFVVSAIVIIFELVLILGFRRYYEDFKYLYKINLIAFIIFLFFIIMPVLLFVALLN